MEFGDFWDGDAPAGGEPGSEIRAGEFCLSWLPEPKFRLANLGSSGSGSGGLGVSGFPGFGGPGVRAHLCGHIWGSPPPEDAPSPAGAAPEPPRGDPGPGKRRFGDIAAAFWGWGGSGWASSCPRCPLVAVTVWSPRSRGGVGDRPLPIPQLLHGTAELHLHHPARGASGCPKTPLGPQKSPQKSPRTRGLPSLLPPPPRALKFFCLGTRRGLCREEKRAQLRSGGRSERRKSGGILGGAR